MDNKSKNVVSTPVQQVQSKTGEGQMTERTNLVPVILTSREYKGLIA